MSLPGTMLGAGLIMLGLGSEDAGFVVFLLGQAGVLVVSSLS